ncbi:Ig-like domain-containing protein [Taibaiella soli]|nr:T9SS type A sorting domain-containing protein [Taibaiella soli]
MLLILFQLCAQQTKAQLSGTVTVPSASYATLNDVVSALNSQGVGSSGVTVNITAGNPQYAPAGGYQLGSTTLNSSLTASSRLLINGNGNTITSNVGTSGSDGMFTMRGTDYVTINALHLVDTNTVSYTTEMEWGYGMVKLSATAPFDGCQYNVISNCNIQLNKLNTNVPNAIALATYGGSKGIMMMNIALSALTTQLPIAAPSDANSYNVVKGCDIRSCNHGIYIYGYAAASNYALYDQSNIIGGYGANDGNTISNYGGGANEASAVYIFGYANNTLIRGNTINNMLNGGIASANVLDGIYHGAAVGGNVIVRKNNINLTQGPVASNLIAVYLNCGGTNANEIDIDTNTVAVSSTGAQNISTGINAFNVPGAANVLSCTANRISETSSSNGNHWLVYFSGASFGSNPRWAINDNKIDGINRTGVPISGSTMGFYQSGSLIGGTAFDFLRNKVTNVNAPGYFTNNSQLYPMNIAGGVSPYPIRTVSFDTISNINGGGAWFYGLFTATNGTGSVISNNLVTNIVDTGTIYGISTNSGGAVSVFNNTVSNLTLNGNGVSAMPAPMYGLIFTVGTTGTVDVYNNTVTNLQNNQVRYTLNSGVFTAGMYVFTGVNLNFYNNMISDLRAPNATGFSPVVGLYLSNNGKFYNIYNNTINIGPGFMPIGSSGTDFGATGIFFPSGNGAPIIDIRNNIIRVNAAPNGVGVVSALRALTGVANTPPYPGTGLAPTSGGNVYWTPADANIYLYCEGTSLAGLTNMYNLANDPGFNTNCSKYKKFFYPAEASTFTENNLSQIGSTPTYAPTGSSFAKQNAIATIVPAVTLDYSGIIRTMPADAGALQFTGTAAGDFTPPAISYTALSPKTYCLSAPVLTASISDASGVNTTTNAPRLYYRKASESDTFGVYPGNNVSSFNGWKYVTGVNTGGSNFSFAFDYSILTSSITGGDSVVYFIAAQDNNTNPNVGVSLVGLASTFCPTTVNLPPAAGPTTQQVSKTAFQIFPQPVLPKVTPATAAICQGASTKLTAVPTDNPKMATLGTQGTFNGPLVYPTPFGEYNGSDHEQYLILASELTTQGLTAGNMTSIAFNMYAPYPAADSNLNNFSIQLANTTVSAFPAANLVTTGFTPVYNATYRPPATTGWTTINFQAPFYWDGVSNVAVDVSFLNCTTCNTTSSCTTTSAVGNNGQVYQTLTPFVSVISVRASNNCSIPSFFPSGSFQGTTSNSRPDMQLMGRQAFNVNWVPTTGLFKDSLMTMPVAVSDTNSVVWAGPSTLSTYGVTNVFNGGCNSIPGTVSTVNVNPKPTATTTPATTASFCGGTNVTINGSTGSNYTYQWLNGTTPIGGATNATYTASAAGAYTFKATNSFGCSATAAISVSNTLPPAATILANNTTICQGDSAMLDANAGLGYTYQWLQNNTPISGATSLQYAAKTTGSYTVNVYNASNCFGTSVAKAVSVNPLDVTVTPSGSLSFCTGSNVVLSVLTASNQTYQWMNNGASISGETNASYTANATGNYSVAVSNSVSGCNRTSTVQVVTVGSGPAASISAAGPASVCAGNTVTLNTTPATGVTYQWLENGVAISGATNTSYTATTSDNYSLRVYSSATCFSTSTPITVAINQLPNVVTTPAAGAATFCQNGTTILTAPTGSNLNYQWSFNGNPINGGTSYNYSAGNAGTYAVAVSNSQTGCTATSGNIVLTQVAAPSAPVITSGPTTICSGDSTLLSLTPVAGLTYQWRFGSTAITGATGNSVYVKLAGNYTVVASAGSGCTASSNIIPIVVNGINIITNPLPGTSQFCPNVPRNLSLTNGTPATQTYQWNFNGSPISGATSNQYAATAAGTYTISVTSTQTGCTVSSGNIVLTALPLPSVTTTGPTGLCAGDTAHFTASSTNVNAYQWQNNGSDIAGATSTSYTTLSSGNYRVYVLNVYGCMETSSVIAFSYYTHPSAAVSGPFAICAGDTATLSVSSGNSYVWKLNGNAISGATNATYSTTTAGAYTISVTSPQNCKDSSAVHSLVVNALPTPAITLNQQTMTVTGTFNAYQWYFNGTAISGANTASYTATQIGNYYVVVTDANGCSNKSNTINVTDVGVRSIVNNTAIHIYPNPTTSIVNIEAPVNVNVIISDLSGKQLINVKNVKRVDLGDMAAGVYMMTILDTDNHPIAVEKIFKSE